MFNNLEKTITFFKYFLVFFAGILSGGILGVLLAPKSGKELRGDFITKSNEFTNLTKKELTKIQEMGYSRIERLSKSLNKKGNDLKSNKLITVPVVKAKSA